MKNIDATEIPLSQMTKYKKNMKQEQDFYRNYFPDEYF